MRIIFRVRSSIAYRGVAMKQFLFVLICSFLCVCNACASSAKQDAPSIPIIKLDSTSLVYDIGGVKKDSVSVVTLRIQNKLDRALNIREVRSSCDCVQVAYAPQTLKRNGIAELKITFDTTDLKDETESAIYILTDDMKYEVISLKIILRLLE